MKSLFFSRSRIACGLIACCAASLSFTVNAQTVDIAEFLLVEPGHTWDLSGTASWSGIGIPVTASVVTEEGAVLHGTETTQLILNGSGSAFFQTLEVNQIVNLSLSPTHLMLHSRVGRLWLNSSLDDEDIETYTVPAALLPRLITVGERYYYTAELDSGSFDDSVFVESLETIDTGLGSVETIKLVIFSGGSMPVTLWLGRNVGYMKASITTTLNGLPLTMDADLTSMDLPWAGGSSVQAIWGGTVAYSDGWRYSDWLGYFWTSDVNSYWINHFGLNWIYCIGNSNDLWMYINQIGWFWSNGVSYPWMFDATNGKYLMNSPGSMWFFDPETGGWIDLAP